MVVPGTMRPTLAGCLSMNIHGKNNFRHGPIGQHVLDFDLLTTDGTVLHCSRTQNAEVFHAAISGLGLLGAFTRISLQQKRVESGLLRVRASRARGLDELFEIFEQRLPSADYLVGWVDCLAGGRGLGRGLVHDANYVARDEDPFGARSLQLEQQSLPGSVPAERSQVPRKPLRGRRAVLPVARRLRVLARLHPGLGARVRTAWLGPTAGVRTGRRGASRLRRGHQALQKPRSASVPRRDEAPSPRSLPAHARARRVFARARLSPDRPQRRATAAAAPRVDRPRVRPRREVLLREGLGIDLKRRPARARSGSASALLRPQAKARPRVDIAERPVAPRLWASD
jgi:hypothetical protein